MLAQQVNFLKVSRRDSLRDMMIDVAPMLCAKAKNRHLSEGCSGPLRHPIFEYTELVSWSRLKWFTSDTSIRYEDKTTAGVPALQLVDTLRSCTFVPSRASYFKLYMKLVLCCRIEAAKMLNN